jgi:hypothetical protein
VRTTLTIDADVAALLKQEVRKSGRPLKQVVNDRLRLGFTAAKQPARKPFKVKPFNLGLPHFTKVEELLEQLEGPDYR